MLLGTFFFATALIYACVGFGGGSTYNALLVLNDTDYRILPFIALSCNIIVVSGGVWFFSKAGHINIKKILPWILFSVPAAWIGGYIEVPETVFIGLLGCTLLIAGIKMLWPEEKAISIKTEHTLKLVHSSFTPSVIGGLLGLLAGLTGIGGGIFLAPILHFLRWGDPKNIAGTCSLFILVNSLSGLIGQTMKLNEIDALSSISSYWILFPSVLIGGQIGSWLGSTKLDVVAVKKVTALLILYVSARLLYRFCTLV
tara:strand:- start:27025 stop:27792 length:768 start_codon:yes stop_codon:yes gene_type:complete